MDLRPDRTTKNTLLSLSPVSQLTVTRQLEREARRLGRSLVRTGDEDDDDDDDFDDDIMDLEASDVIFTPLLRSGFVPACSSVSLPFYQLRICC